MTRREQLIDITQQVKQVVKDGNLENKLVSVYAQGAAAAIMIQETGMKVSRQMLLIY